MPLEATAATWEKRHTWLDRLLELRPGEPARSERFVCAIVELFSDRTEKKELKRAVRELVFLKQLARQAILLPLRIAGLAGDGIRVAA